MKTRKNQPNASKTNIEQKARRLLGPHFLYYACRKIGELGVIGEKRIRLILLLVALTRTLLDPISVLVKGSTSSGKTTTVRDTLQLLQSDVVIMRAGLSGKALAYGKGSLSGKILFVNEYRCGKDAQQLLRLTQSGESIHHEATTVSGRNRSTQTVERTGTPVVLTTTTDDEVFADDESRFLSVWADESPEQTRAILLAQAQTKPSIDDRELQVWRTATSLVARKPGDFSTSPEWLTDVFSLLPVSRVRVRRDAKRFLSFTKAIALCRADPWRTNPLEISFQDYCVAYIILEEVFASTLQGVPTRETEIAKAVEALHARLERPVTTREIARFLHAKKAVIYKHTKRAVQHRLVQYESVTRERNVKRLMPRGTGRTSFLPTPQTVLDRHPSIGESVTYVDPFTGQEETLRRTNARSAARG